MLRSRQAGFTLVELLIVVAVIGILSAIAIPALYRARQSSYEASAIGSLRTINSAQASYASACGSGFYAPTLDDLGRPPSGSSVGFISPDLGRPMPVVKSGYEFTMTGTVSTGSPASCNGLGGSATLSGYAATATPVPGGGWKYFATNTTGTVWQHHADLSSVGDAAPPSAGHVLQ